MKTSIAFIITVILISTCFICIVIEADESLSSPFKKTAEELAAKAAKEGVYNYDKLWGPEIYAFQRLDAKNSFPDNAVLFAGSSSIKLWDTARYFPELKVINRGFGGADIKAVNYFFDKVVAPYKPSKIVFFAGGNALGRGAKPWVVCEDFKVFYKLCSEKVPDAEVIFISIKFSQPRIKLWPNIEETNTLIKAFCQTKSNLHYLGLADCLRNDDGNVIEKLYQKDKIHLSKDGYRLWTDKLKPLLLASENTLASD